MEQTEQTKTRKDYNRKRSNIISALRRKNIQEAQHLANYLNKNHARLNDLQMAALARLRKNMLSCGAHSLYGEHNGEYTYIGSHTCDNKNCHICNYNRKKRIRRKLMQWFRNNPHLIELKKNGKVVTDEQYLNKYYGENYREVKYDLMHLTLTVPHTENGWHGTKFYYQEIMQAFNLMRKQRQIKKMIYGGEFGVETTRNENGLHIHIHALLLVKKEKGNRDLLHKLILKEWNRITVEPGMEPEPLSEKRIKAIKKGNKTLTEAEIKALDSRGATLIGLETIYTLDQSGQKIRGKELTEGMIMAAILETVSYHFKPLALEDDGHLNYDIISEIAVAIYKRPLYKKFGCWHGEKSLNLKQANSKEGMLEDYGDANNVTVDETTGIMVNEDTGEIIDAGYTAYYMTDCAGVFHIPEEGLKIVFSRKARDKIKEINALNTAEALVKMLEAGVYDLVKQKQRENSVTN